MWNQINRAPTLDRLVASVCCLSSAFALYCLLYDCVYQFRVLARAFLLFDLLKLLYFVWSDAESGIFRFLTLLYTIRVYKGCMATDSKRLGPSSGICDSYRFTSVLTLATYGIQSKIRVNVVLPTIICELWDPSGWYEADLAAVCMNGDFGDGKYNCSVWIASRWALLYGRVTETSIVLILACIFTNYVDVVFLLHAHWSMNILHTYAHL